MYLNALINGDWLTTIKSLEQAETKTAENGHNGDGCVLTSTLCKYDLKVGDLFVLSWTMVRRVMRGSISLEVCAVFCYCLFWLDA